MTTALFAVFIILMFGVSILIWRLLFAKALRAVVGAFREHGARSAKSAATLEELGFAKPRGAFGKAFRPRDYRAQALRMLAQQSIVLPASEGKFYLSEDALDSSRLKSFAKIT